MSWIKDRIDAEYKKHFRVTGGLDWSLLAEKKIIAQLKEDLIEHHQIPKCPDCKREDKEYACVDTFWFLRYLNGYAEEKT